MNASMATRTVTLSVVLILAPLTLLAQTGTIAGKVRVQGVVPAERILEVTVDQEFCGETVPAGDIQVSRGGLAFAVVSVEGESGEVIASEYLLSNTGCRFDPPAMAVGAGSVLLMDNQDEMLHNTHLSLRYGESRKRTVTNSALPRKGVVIRSARALRWPGVVEVKCDVHPWMHAMILVFDHPYFAVSDEVGSFEITGVPEGTHKLKVWHEVFGEDEQEVVVKAGGVASADFVYNADEAAADSREH